MVDRVQERDAAAPSRRVAPRGARDATEGPILGVLITLAVPIVATNVFQSLYQLIDTFWVGRLGADAVAAVSLSFPISFLMISAGGGLSVAGAILVAPPFGAGQARAQNHAEGQPLLVVQWVPVCDTRRGEQLLGVFDRQELQEPLRADPGPSREHPLEVELAQVDRARDLRQ